MDKLTTQKCVRIAKSLMAEQKTKWLDLDDREKYDVIKKLIQKHGLDKDYDPLKRRSIDIHFTAGFQDQVEANVTWPSRGANSIEDAEKFAKGLSDAVNALKKAAEDLKKQYPEIKIVEQSKY